MTWTLADTGIIASGLAYNGVDPVTKEPKFDRIYGIDITGCEFSIFSHSWNECWNHGGHMWLKRYIYFRLNKAINREMALYGTYIISALWHGFYPMYFAAFLMYAVITENFKDIYKLYAKYPLMRTLPARMIL